MNDFKQEMYDLVIVGGGFSGLSAAVEAGQKGFSVLVLEKGRTIGGAGNYVEGAMGVGSRLQQEKGIKVDPLELLHDELAYSHYEASASHLKKFIDASGENINWLQELGVDFVKVGKQGESWPTIHTFAGGGHAVIELLVKKCQELGVEIVTSHSGQKLLIANGKIAGITVMNEATGQMNDLKTSRVLLATGGYVDNKELIQAKIPNADRLMVVGTGKATGDGMKLAYAAGAGQASLGAIQYGGGAVYDKTRPQFTHMMTQIAAAFTQEAVLWVNEQGERFVNEDVNDNMCHAGNAILTQSRVFSILDQASVDHLTNIGLFKEVGNSPVSPDNFEHLKEELQADLAHHERYLTKAETLEELSQKLSLPQLEKTISHYNKLVETGQDSDFGKKSKYLTPVKTGPFYAVELGVGMACAIGGLRVDNGNRVLNSHGFAVSGLYASGNDAAGMMVGDTYAVTLPGSTAGYAVFSGRNAVSNM